MPVSKYAVRETLKQTLTHDFLMFLCVFLVFRHFFRGFQETRKFSVFFCQLKYDHIEIMIRSVAIIQIFT